MAQERGTENSKRRNINREVLHAIVKSRLDEEGLVRLRDIFSVPDHIPDEQAQRWVVAWIERRTNK